MDAPFMRLEKEEEEEDEEDGELEGCDCMNDAIDRSALSL